VNLNAIVAPLTAAITPRETISIQQSTGYVTAADGSRAPSYAAAVSVLASIQELSSKDLAKLGNLNTQEQQIAIYLPGRWSGVIRASAQGGDMITRADGSKWLLTMVMEDWLATGGWVKVVATLQNGS
jgi:hypothetical protein